MNPSRGDADLRDAVWQAAVELLTAHDSGHHGWCRRCRCASPCPGQVLARTGLDAALGLPTGEADYWFGLVRARAVQAHGESELLPSGSFARIVAAPSEPRQYCPALPPAQSSVGARSG